MNDYKETNESETEFEIQYSFLEMRKAVKEICTSHNYCEQCDFYLHVIGGDVCYYADDAECIPCYWSDDE